MAETIARKARIVSVIAATSIAIACGTNYAYSAWGPEFAERMELSTTESNIIGAAGNFGMYATGVPAGLVIDNRGPRLAVLIGSILVGWGYFAIHRGYMDGPGSTSVAFLSIASFATGAGSCSAFSAAVKIAAFNWPEHRGTATAFPLSAFGLSAFFFTAIAHLSFHGSTGHYLLMLSIGTFVLCLIALPFARLIVAESGYSTLIIHGRATRRSSDQHRQDSLEGEQHQTFLRSTAPDADPEDVVYAPSILEAASRDTSRHQESKTSVRSHQREVTGLAMLRLPEFYQLFTLLGLLAGVGLMTINNIGNDARALWFRFNRQASHDFIQDREQLHVSLLSICSFVGRFLSGIGSDLLVKRMKSRFWCITTSASVFAVVQLLALCVSNPNSLFLVSCLTGLAYGALFGVMPALVADAFGVLGLSLNWGFMILAPVLSGNVFNIIYGRVFDGHSVLMPSGRRDCPDGIDCYRSAYWITLASSIIGIVVALWCIKYEHRKQVHGLRNPAPED